MPDTKFRFTLRFRDLRPWELGAVLFALEPERIDSFLPHLNIRDIVQSQLMTTIPAQPKHQPRFALKLGHGRPLGMGSVQIQVDELWFVNDNSDKNGLKPVEWKKDESFVFNKSSTDPAIKAFCQKVNEYPKFEIVLIPWLKLHQYRGLARAEYPRSEEDGEIYTFHSERRQNHAKTRRSNAPLQPDEKALKPLLGERKKFQ
jgi:hypothetical protein